MFRAIRPGIVGNVLGNKARIFGGPGPENWANLLDNSAREMGQIFRAIGPDIPGNKSGHVAEYVGQPGLGFWGNNSRTVVVSGPHRGSVFPNARKRMFERAFC